MRRQRGSTAAPVWLLILVVFLGSAAEATACPVCTRDRLLQSYWHLKVLAILMAAPLLVTFTRLDVVRVLYTFLPLALVNIKLQLLAMWYAHPAARTDGVPLGLINALLVATTLLAPVLICSLGRFAFYRRDGKKGFLLWQPFAYCAVVWMASPWLRV
jgi:hypothetical protein